MKGVKVGDQAHTTCNYVVGKQNKTKTTCATLYIFIVLVDIIRYLTSAYIFSMMRLQAVQYGQEPCFDKEK